MLVDGNGVTTLVALIGCPLSCKYCINSDGNKSSNYRSVSPEQLVEDISIDYCYYVATGGGVTFGGGEPLLYIDAILDFIDIRLPAMAVNIETSLNCNLPEEKFVKLINSVSELIIDIKTLDKDKYLSYTALSIDELLKHLNIISKSGMQDKCKIRIPIIPDFTTMEDCERYKVLILKLGFQNIEIFNYVIK